MSTWQPIETAPEGNGKDGPFFDVTWAGDQHRYLPVPARQIDCFKERGVIKRTHGYPSMMKVFLTPPTHWMPTPASPHPADPAALPPSSTAPGAAVETETHHADQ